MQYLVVWFCFARGISLHFVIKLQQTPPENAAVLIFCVISITLNLRDGHIKLTVTHFQLLYLTLNFKNRKRTVLEESFVCNCI